MLHIWSGSLTDSGDGFVAIWSPICWCRCSSFADSELQLGGWHQQFSHTVAGNYGLCDVMRMGHEWGMSNNTEVNGRQAVIASWWWAAPEFKRHVFKILRSTKCYMWYFWLGWSGVLPHMQTNRHKAWLCTFAVITLPESAVPHLSWELNHCVAIQISSNDWLNSLD